MPARSDRTAILDICRSLPRRGAALAMLAAILMSGCSYFATRFAPEKAPLASDSQLARDATQQLRAALYASRYEDLPAILESLTQAYVANPRDPEVTLSLALGHLWTVSERRRVEHPTARVTDSLILAEKYFSEARRLNPEDGRIDGWLASVRAGIAQVHQDEKLKRAAYFDLKDAARRYPEFNEFVVGFVMSNVPHGDPKLQEAVDAFWRNIDVCLGQKVARTDLDIRPYLKLATQTGPARVCWSTAKVPHNLEGFLVAMGDALVKNGQPEIARKVYSNATYLPSYESWQHKAMLQERIQSAEDWARIFAKETDPAKQPVQLRGSAVSCTACHGV